MLRKFSRMLSVLLCVVLLAGLLPGALAAGDGENPFTDVKESDYFYDAVVWAYENNVTKGTSDTAFSPLGACTRGQVVTFLWRAMGQPKPKTVENPFADVPETAYYRDAVLWAVEQGITNGTGKDAFSPDTPCAYAHILTFLWRSVTGNSSSSYGSWYEEPMDWANKQGLLKETALGKNGDKAMTNCPRCDVVTYLWRALEADPANGLVPFGEAHGWTFSQLRELTLPAVETVLGDISFAECHPVEATHTAPVITCSMPDAEGCVTYTIAYNTMAECDVVLVPTGDEASYVVPTAYNDYYIFDYYTGAYLYTAVWTTPEDPVAYIELDSTIVFGGVEYPVYYCARAEGDHRNCQFTRSGNRVLYKGSYVESYTMTFRVPQDYDGLVLGIDYKTMPEIPDLEDVVYPEFWDYDESIDNWLFYRVSDCTKMGNGLTCTFDEDGTLTISGTGKIDDYDLYLLSGLVNYNDSVRIHLPPWNAYRESIRSVVLKPGVTGIGRYAFAGCSNLKSVTIPDTVTDIGDYAFQETILAEITIPQRVTNISSTAFSNAQIENFKVSKDNPKYCAVDGVLMTKDEKQLLAYPSGNKRSTYTVPDTVSRIGDSAFAYAKMEDITIPSCVTDISNGAFVNSSLKEFKVSADNPEYCAVDGVLMSKDKKRLIAYPSEHERTAYSVPDTVTEIGNYAFSTCRNLTELTIPADVTVIPQYALPMLYTMNIYFGGSSEEWDVITKDWSDNYRELFKNVIHYHSGGTE